MNTINDAALTAGAALNAVKSAARSFVYAEATHGARSYDARRALEALAYAAAKVAPTHANAEREAFDLMLAALDRLVGPAGDLFNVNNVSEARTALVAARKARTP